MPIPAYMWLKDYGGAEIKGSWKRSKRIISIKSKILFPIQVASGDTWQAGGFMCRSTCGSVVNCEVLNRFLLKGLKGIRS